MKVDFFIHLDINKVELDEDQKRYIEVIKNLEKTKSYRLVRIKNINQLLRCKSINLNVIPGLSYKAERDRIEHRGSNNCSWFGSVFENGDVILTIIDNNISGLIRLKRVKFELWPLGPGICVLIYLDQTDYLPD